MTQDILRKSEYREYRHNKEKHLETKYGKIKRSDKFKYLGEWIEPNNSEKFTISTRVHKFETAFRLTHQLYNKKSISRNASYDIIKL